MDKIQFLKSELATMLSGLPAGQSGKWGRMNAQQMVEHMSDYLRIASGKHRIEPVNSPEITQKSYAFMMSERPFRENTPNQLLPDVPPPAKHASMKEAIDELQKEMDDFFDVYTKNPGLRNSNPFFGNLNYEEQIHLLHKHAMHHARQFGLVE